MLSLNSEAITFKKPRNRNRKGTGSDSHINLDILRTFEEPSETIPRRIELYQKNLDIICNHILRQRERYNSELRKNLDAFLKSSFELVDKDECVVPVGIIESGLSGSENSEIFDCLQEELRNFKDDSRSKIYVVRLQPGAGSTSKAVFQEICRQITDENGDLTNEAELDSEKSPKMKEQRHFSLFDIKSFLRHSLNFKIAILVQDVDYFSNLILSQLLTLMGSAKLPILFIFGTTHGHFINSIVPSNSSCTFAIDKFYSVSAKERLDDFMRRILFSQRTPFRVSGAVASYLESHYLEENLSVEYLCNSVKFCLRSHFLTARSAFCTLDKRDDYSETELEFLKSFAVNATCKNPSLSKRLKKSDATFKDDFELSVDKITNWGAALRLMSFLNLRLSESPLGNSYARVYANCFGGYTIARENDDQDSIHKFFQALCRLSKNELVNLLKDCIDFLGSKNGVECNVTGNLLSEFEVLLSDLQVSTAPENSQQSLPRRSKKKTFENIRDLQKSLRASDGIFERLQDVRLKMTQYLRTTLKQHLPPFSTLQFSNVFVFDDLTQLISTLFPANYLQINEDLLNPAHFLHCDCCSSLEPASIAGSLPDVSIIHKLLLENAYKKVDLNGIYHAFFAVVQPQGKKKGPKGDFARSSSLIRFRRAVGELQHMGFLKRSKSKPDEVTRLTWW